MIAMNNDDHLVILYVRAADSYCFAVSLSHTQTSPVSGSVDVMYCCMPAQVPQIKRFSFSICARIAVVFVLLKFNLPSRDSPCPIRGAPYMAIGILLFHLQISLLISVNVTVKLCCCCCCCGSLFRRCYT